MSRKVISAALVLAIISSVLTFVFTGNTASAANNLPVSQLRIPYIDNNMPNIPSPFSMKDWYQTARDYR